MTQLLLQRLLLAWIALGVLVLPLTLWVTAPFGRHVNRRFGATIDNRLGWLIMESPAIWMFSIIFFATSSIKQPISFVLWMIWISHYVYRGLIFPFRLKTTGKRIPLVIVICAFLFQLINGYFNGISLGKFGQTYTIDWLINPQFVFGFAVFLIGWSIHFRSDSHLLSLRKENDTGYSIPRGGLFESVSCPNFLGEIIQWTGWALMTWNLAGISFAVWTAANLIPRALAHHQWYQQEFDDYPACRKAILPKIL